MLTSYSFSVTDTVKETAHCLSSRCFHPTACSARSVCEQRAAVNAPSPIKATPSFFFFLTKEQVHLMAYAIIYSLMKILAVNRYTRRVFFSWHTCVPRMVSIRCKLVLRKARQRRKTNKGWSVNFGWRSRELLQPAEQVSVMWHLQFSLAHHFCNFHSWESVKVG